LERIGDTHTRKVDVRIIAATNRDLKKEVDDCRFRQDLFYRLSVFPIEIRPLRERRDDIAPLAAHFVRQSARRLNRLEPRITQAALSQLASYDWPGNVRELQNAVERAVILSSGGPLSFDLPEPNASDDSVTRTQSASKPDLPTYDQLKRRERDVIAAALQKTNGKVFGPSGAAELLGMKPTTLASRIKALRVGRNKGTGRV
jgi:transcriptional regulator with GAF, ATPase, and Fis domain